MPAASMHSRDLGRLLARGRRSKGWSLSELARRAKVGKATLSRWESGAAEPTIQILDDVLDCLELTVEDREQAYAFIGAPRGIRALRDSETTHRWQHTELGVGSLTLGDMIRALRLRKAMPAAILAERLGASPSAVSLWEQGERIPSTETILRIGRAVGASEKETAALLSVSPVLGSSRVQPCYGILGEQIEHLFRRLKGLDLECLDLDLVLLASDAWRLSKSDPRGFAILKSVTSLRGILCAERGDIAGAERFALQAYDIHTDFHDLDFWLFPPDATLAWVALERSKGSPPVRAFRRAIDASRRARLPVIRKEILLQTLRYAAVWNDLDQLEALRQEAVHEHWRLTGDHQSIDIDWIVSECFVLMGRPHDALDTLPAGQGTPLGRLHMETARGAALLAIGDLRSAAECVREVREVTERTGYSGPDEQWLLASYAEAIDGPPPRDELAARR